MIRGVDTTFLVEAEVVGHPDHSAARTLLRKMLSGDKIAIAPQVLAEFVHVITDPRRFEKPLDISAAMERASLWWNASETKQIFPNAQSIGLFYTWMSEKNLGRKRILDTLLAATYVSNGITTIVTTNVKDFSVFDGIEVAIP